MNCNQCEALMINNTFCHETGCPNSQKSWDPYSEEWRAIVECDNCGEEVFKDDMRDHICFEFDEE